MRVLAHTLTIIVLLATYAVAEQDVTLYFDNTATDSSIRACGANANPGGVQITAGPQLGGASSCGKRAQIKWKNGKNRYHSVNVWVAAHGDYYPAMTSANNRKIFNADQANIDAVNVVWSWGGW